MLIDMEMQLYFRNWNFRGHDHLVTLPKAHLSVFFQLSKFYTTCPLKVLGQFQFISYAAVRQMGERRFILIGLRCLTEMAFNAHIW